MTLKAKRLDEWVDGEEERGLSAETWKDSETKQQSLNVPRKVKKSSEGKWRRSRNYGVLETKWRKDLKNVGMNNSVSAVHRHPEKISHNWLKFYKCQGHKQPWPIFVEG